MRLERARRLLESNKGEDFRVGCGSLTEGLRNRVKALEVMACNGGELYRQREEHVPREQWSKMPATRPAAPKPSRNTARRLRARRQKTRALTGVQAQGLVRPGEDGASDGGVTEAKESEPSRITSTQPSLEEDEEPPGPVDDRDSEDDRPSRWDEEPQM